MSNSKRYLLFGGAGFVGTHFTRYLLHNELAAEVIIADLKTSHEGTLKSLIQPHISSNKIKYRKCDVRKEISPQLEKIGRFDVILNLAAIHREPGHKPAEYFETNLMGARNINKFASENGCKLLVFTSSIAPYGPAEAPRTEESLPVPETPYGCSKLVAETIHETWAKQSPENSLIIIRPGVVFGAGEGGNVSRMVRAIRNRYFIYMGNKRTKKAGIYVKELCAQIQWAVDRAQQDKIQLFNAVMPNCPSVKDYAEAISDTLGRANPTANAPFIIIYSLSFLISLASRIAMIKQPIDPIRIKKLVRSNNIHAEYLLNAGYKFNFKFNEALLDWHNEDSSVWEKQRNQSFK